MAETQRTDAVWSFWSVGMSYRNSVGGNIRVKGQQSERWVVVPFTLQHGPLNRIYGLLSSCP